MTTITKRKQPAAAKSMLSKDFLIPSPLGLPESEQEALFLKILRAVETAFEKQQPKKELEAIWRETKEKLNPDLRDLPKFRKIHERPPTLRGRDFVDELYRLSVITGDLRFFHAIRALDEHGIIDKKKNFTRWRSPYVAEYEAHKNHTMLHTTRKLIKEGWSIRQACTAVAVLYGTRASSLDAAIKQLELLYASDGKKGAA